MTQNISQILNIKMPNNISYIVCANYDEHRLSDYNMPMDDIYECKNCNNFICGKCTIINNEECIMCWQKEECNLCSDLYNMRCWQCGKHIMCVWDCNNNGCRVLQNENGSTYAFCEPECEKQFYWYP